MGADGMSVVLLTSLQTTGTVYNVTIKDVKDTIIPGNTIAPNPTTNKFTAFVLATGGVLQRYFAGYNGNAANLANDPRYPDSPTYSTIISNFSSGIGTDQYGDILSGWLVPPITGDYAFFVSSDDTSRVYLSTNASSSNLFLIAEETAYSGAQQWVTTPAGSVLASKRSDQFVATEWPVIDPGTGLAKITLTANQRYYMEVRHAEGNSADHVAVTWQLPGAPVPVDFVTPPINGTNVLNYLNLDLPTVTIAITIPEPNTRISENSDTPLRANATDPNGPIRRVDFFANDTLIGTSANTTSPYSFTWSRVPRGNYNVVARALGRQGYTVSSAPVNLIAGDVLPRAIYYTDTGRSPSDDLNVAHLRALGFDVKDSVDNAPVSETTGAALLVFSPWVTSGDIGTRFNNIAIPFMNMEFLLAGRLGFCSTNVNGRQVGGLTDINITMTNHPLAAGFSGPVTVFTGPGNLGTIGNQVVPLPILRPSAIVVATALDGGGVEFPTLFAFEKGAALDASVVANGTAPARRVEFFAGDNGFAILSADGMKLFDAAVRWLVPPTLSIAPGDAGSVTIRFTGNLESTDSLTPPVTWSPVAGTNSVIIQPTGAQRFYHAVWP